MAPAPTNLLLSSATVNENDLLGVAIGQLTAVGANGQSLATAGLIFSLVAGAGDADNSRFRITAGGQLVANAVFDREVRSQLTVRIRVSDAAGQAFEKTFSIAVYNLPDPIVTRPLSSAALAWGDSDRLVELGAFFDDPFTTGKVATFQLAPVQVAGNNQATLGSGRIRVLLFDQPGQGAPLTTANLEAYRNAGRYNNTFIHRSVPGFVLQGGGFNQVTTAQGATVPEVTTFPALRNEFSAGRSNLRGTIAMAKLGSDPNSATSQWFWSLADNSANLDNQNGGFTVFGRVLGEADLRTLDAMAAVPIRNASASLGSTFSQLPLSNNTLTSNNLLQFSSITITKQPELSYALIRNSAPDLLQATLAGGRLSLRPLANRQQMVSLTIRATNLLGETVDQTLNLQLLRRPTTIATILGSTVANLAQPTLTGSLAAPLRADEQVEVLANGVPIGAAEAATGSTSWTFQSTAYPKGGSAGQVALGARVKSLDGVAGAAANSWTLGLNSNKATLQAPGGELLKVEDARPLEVRATPIGRWGPGFAAQNAGSVTTNGTLRPGTGQMITIEGLDRYALSLRNAPGSNVDLDLGNGNHAFFLHDSWTPQSSALASKVDADGRRTAARFDQLRSIRMGECSAAGATSLVDLTSADFSIGPITVIGGNRAGSRNVIWTSAADDTIICGGANNVIFAGGGRNTLRLSKGSDRLQYVGNGGAHDMVSQFNPSQDRVELWGLKAGTTPSLSVESDGRGGSVFSWQGNRITFSNTLLNLPTGGGLPAWITVGS
ncbi:MAG: peptidylprolyl isomerase [Cyanobacteriota bacterium]|nr:peptidylprolyl isomerase [Cyanobacteriota bacterium]